MRKWTPSFTDILKTLAHQVQKWFTWTRAAFKRALGITAPIKILTYRGFGNAEVLHVMGRVQEDKPIGSPKEDDSWWNNVKAMYRRFTVDKMAGVRVQVSAFDQTLETTTDEEGFFRFTVPVSGINLKDELWHRIGLELLDDVCPQQAKVVSDGKVLVPPHNATFGVISDIDDTIVESHAADFVKLVRITCLNNARTRMPLAGVSRFYRALERGGDGQSQNPFFYVSSSAWNLYDLLFDFMDLNDIPAGPIMLRDLNRDDQKFIKSGHEHKLEKVERVLQTYPDLPFVLIGDAGQDDPMIYREVVRRDPRRIRAVYIRTVSKDARNERARRVAEEVCASGTAMMLIENDVEQAFDHAAKIGLLTLDNALQHPKTFSQQPFGCDQQKK